MHQECEVSIITVNYNGLKDTCSLIDTIPIEKPSIEVIVVDNASKANEASVLEDRYPHINVIQSNTNLGFAGGNNLGIKAAKGKYLYLVNNDTEFKEFNIQSLIERIESSDNIGIVCPKIRFWGQPQPIQFAGYTPLSKITMRNKCIGFGEQDKGQYNTARPTPYAHGAAMLIKHEAIEKVGFMPENYFLYYEELDWSMMFKRAGYEIWYEPAAEIFHKESSTTGQNSPLRTYYITRNRLLFTKRNNRGIYQMLSYLYIICVVSTRDIIKHTIACRLDLTRATFRGIKDFLMHN